MRFKGCATFKFVDIETGVERIEERENFIFIENYNDLFQGTGTIPRLYVVARGSDVYPRFNRSKNYYGYPGSLYYSGHAPTGTTLKKFFPKTSDSPAYWEYYSLFLPPASTSAIASLCLSQHDTGDNQLPYPYYTPWDTQVTAINLSPACYQAPTEYLNVYYRLILIEDELDVINNDWIKEQFVLDVDRSDKLLYQNDNIQLYPFKIKQDLGANGFVNYLSSGYTSLPSKQTIHPNGLNLSLYSARKIYTWPDSVPNQYNQIQNTYFNTVLRAGRSRLWYDVSLLHPDKITPNIGEDGFTGIGNVFGTSSSSDSYYFDAAYFPAGSGKMFASGQWDAPSRNDAFPSRFVAYITQSGATASSMQYNVREYFDSPWAALNLFPSLYTNPHYWPEGVDSTINTAKSRMYSNPEHVHIHGQARMRKWVENRAFISYDSTGITIYDIAEGTLTSFDSFSTPKLEVSDVVDVKVDSFGNIWVACASTGLWKLTITELDTTLVHIGAPPGCQSRVFALDVDNYGNVFAIFWGLGLHYSLDGGTSWVNAIINYPSFSTFDEEGTNSKWRFCTRLIVNPHRDAGDGNAQILLLQRADVNDGSVTAGCWYDQISASVTGITNATLRAQLEFVRSSNRHQSLIVSNLENKWMFLHADGFNESGSYQFFSQIKNENRWAVSADAVMYMPFQHNAGATRVNLRKVDQNGNDKNLEWFRHIEYALEWDETTGAYREYALIPAIGADNPCVIDIGYNESVYDFVRDIDGNSNHNEDVWRSNACFISKNRFVSFECRYTYYQNHYIGWIVNKFMAPAKVNKTITSDLWGWDGGNWVKNHPGSKSGHTSAEILTKGVYLSFQDGPASTSSFVQGDQYTFTCFDGYFKDNSSKIWMKDTVYYRPKTIETTFTPSTVQLYDKTNEKGILNNIISQDWNIDKLPDTTYDGQPLVLNGDFYYPYVTYLNYMKDTGTYGPKDEKSDAEPTTVFGSYSPSSDLTIDWAGSSEQDATTFFDGDTGIYYAPQAKFSPGSNTLAVEAWVYPITSNKIMYLADFRNATNEIGSWYINTQGQLTWNNGVTLFGQTGSSVIVDQWNHVAIVRKANNAWEMILNGTSVATWNDSTGFPATRPMHIGKRFALQSDWIYENMTIPYNKYPNPSGVSKAEAIVPSSANTYNHTVYRYRTLTSGTYTFSIFAKQGSRRYFMLRTGLNNTDVRTVYDFQTNTFVTTGAGHTTGSEILSGGWVRLWVTVSEASNNVSRYFSFGPTLSADSLADWSGDGIEEACYVWGAMLVTGSLPTTYTPSGSFENLWTTDSENFGGNYRGFEGNMSNFRYTIAANRYDGNVTPLPNERFKNIGNDYTGARLRFPGNYLQGSVISKKELVGDWTVVFRDLPSYFAEMDGSRPTLAFGITSAPVVSNLTDIAYRLIGGSNNWLRFEKWTDSWGGGSWNGVTAVRIRKVGVNVFVDVSTSNGIYWSQIHTSTDYAGIHYIAMWQEKPSSDNVNRPLVSPSVEIVTNGSDYVSRVGDPNFSSGAYHPRFLAVDSYWESDFKIALNGVKTTKNRSNYQAEALPLQGEVYMHQHGTLRFHPDDVGKAITGRVMSLHD